MEYDILFPKHGTHQAILPARSAYLVGRGGSVAIRTDCLAGDNVKCRMPT